MKRSIINAELQRVEDEMEKYSLSLPAFSTLQPGDWKRISKEQIKYIMQRQLGWDVTDLGLGDFYTQGLTLFTIRNGGEDTPYAEKLMFPRINQVTPFHFHKSKIEDIINRAGGLLVISFSEAPEMNSKTLHNLKINLDGEWINVEKSPRITLSPGQSVRIQPGVVHSFWAEKADVVAGEVSSLNDDLTDNFFPTQNKADEVSRFPRITEDAEPGRLLVGDYRRFLRL